MCKWHQPCPILSNSWGPSPPPMSLVLSHLHIYHLSCMLYALRDTAHVLAEEKATICDRHMLLLVDVQSFCRPPAVFCLFAFMAKEEQVFPPA